MDHSFECKHKTGVAGGTASGKTSVCKIIAEKAENKSVVIISQDSYYKNLTEEQLKNVHQYNFDHPGIFFFSYFFFFFL